VTYLNRLSDLLFILTRVANGTDGEVLWVPGGERSAAHPPTTTSAVPADSGTTSSELEPEKEQT
jgi:hypothetical protein